MLDQSLKGKVATLVASGVMGATNAGTTAVDMKGCRTGLLIITFTKGTDVPTTVILQSSSDNGVNDAFASLKEVADADLAATATKIYFVNNIERYLRMKWTRALANADSYWSILFIGDHELRTPVE